MILSVLKMSREKNVVRKLDENKKILTDITSICKNNLLKAIKIMRQLQDTEYMLQYNEDHPEYKDIDLPEVVSTKIDTLVTDTLLVNKEFDEFFERIL